MSSRSLTLGLVLLAAGACRDVRRLHGTAVVITVETGGRAVDQLRYEGLDEGALVFGPTLRPETAGEAPVPATSAVRVLLPDALDGRTLDLHVAGLAAGAPVAEGHARVVVSKGVERFATVVLGDLEVTCATCPGCCSPAGECLTTSAAACGAPGAQCEACDALTADRCGPDGRCACGNGPPCSLAIGGDRCVEGQCQCGDGPACAPGLECLQRACQCTAASCAGCCDQGQCVRGGAPNACGAGGRACLDCGASTCTAGECATAMCNPLSCPSGCCAGATCLPGTDTAACGVGGRACVSCGAGACDAGTCVGTCSPETCPGGCCQAGVCVPGTAPGACGSGGVACLQCAASCVGQVCVDACGPATCPTGCCQGGVCLSGNSDSACGSGGGACESCGDGTCRQRACVAPCTPSSCPTGCCDASGACLGGTTKQACGAGGAACVNCAGNQQCVAGSCR